MIPFNITHEIHFYQSPNDGEGRYHQLGQIFNPPSTENESSHYSSIGEVGTIIDSFFSQISQLTNTQCHHCPLLDGSYSLSAILEE